MENNQSLQANFQGIKDSKVLIHIISVFSILPKMLLLQ